MSDVVQSIVTDASIPWRFGGSRGASYEVTSAPASEPVTTAEFKTHARIDHSDEDTYVDTLVAAARQVLEEWTGRAFINQTIVLSMDAFPAEDAIYLPRPPLSSVTSIVYEDEDSSSQTFAATKYHVDTSHDPGRVSLEPDQVWPDTEGGRMNAVQITYVAGYGSAASNVPAAIKHAVKLLAADWYVHRETIGIGTVAYRIPEVVERLINPYRILEAA